MKNKIVLVLLLVFLVSLTSAHALNLKTVAVDTDTDSDINPSTITFAGITKTGTPDALYSNVAGGTVYEITHSATNYQSDTDDLFFDAKLNTCTSGQDCSLSSSLSGNTFTTNCLYNAQFSDYECTVTNNGASYYYFYKPSEERVTYINYLKSQPGGPPVGTPTRLFDNSKLYTIDSFAADSVSFNDINPSTITFGGIVRQGTPMASFNNAKSDTVYEISHNANGYSSDTDDVYLDHGLSTCSGSTCTLQSKNSNGVDFDTECNLNNGEYECTVTSQGISYYYYYNKATNKVEIVNFLVAEGPISPPAGDNIPHDTSKTYLLRAVTVDANSDDDINPSTITVGGVVKQGTPRAEFNNIKSDTVYEITNTATGYIADTDDIYFDHQLSTCNGLAQCDLSSKSAANQLFITQCNFNAQFNDFECTVKNNGVESYFFFKPTENRVTYINYLVADSIPAQFHAPDITSIATPLTGDAPLTVTFTIDVTDQDNDLASVRWHFGDGQSRVVQPKSTITHTYLSAGDFVASVVAFDAKGLVSTKEHTIKVTGAGSSLPPFDNNHNFLLRTVSVDAITDDDINPSTITVGGVKKTATPRAEFTNIRSNTVYEISNEAPNYIADTDDLYFDFQLPTCTGTSCNLESRSASDQNFKTSCSKNILNNDYECIVNNNGVNVPFFYKPSENRVTYINYLVPVDEPTVNEGPIVTFEASVTSGRAPLSVTFTSTASDSDGLGTITLFFGDGTSKLLSAVDTVTHTYTESGEFTAQIVAFDSRGLQTIKQIVIKVDPSVVVVNLAPIANAGVDKNVLISTLVTLDGSGSSDPENQPFTYKWKILAQPVGSIAVLNNPSTVAPSFTPDLVGTYTIELIVNDFVQDSAPDTVVITASTTPVNQKPTAIIAGGDRDVIAGSLVTLDGSLSFDVDGPFNELLFNWILDDAIKPAGSTATLSNPSSSIASFTPDKVGQYGIILSVLDKNGFGLLDVARATITATSTNKPPVSVIAGGNQTVRVGQKVILDGTQSSDPEQQPLSFVWTKFTNPQGSLSQIENRFVSVTSITPDIPGKYEILLVVNDNGIPNLNNFAKTTITAINNNPPVVNAGADKQSNLFEVIRITGSALDADNDPLTLDWAFLSASIPNPTPTLTFVLDDGNNRVIDFSADKEGTYTLQFSANDGLSTVTDTMDVVVTRVNSRPIANAGANKNATINTLVQLDGSASSDPDGDAFTYLWSFDTKPAASTSVLSNTAVDKPTFTPDIVGDYRLKLIVTDAKGLASLPSFVTITAGAIPNTAPIANAGANKNAVVNTLVTLDGSASSDPDGDAFTYLWSFDTKPAASTSVLSNTAVDKPTFTPDIVGDYRLKLIVTDAKGLSSLPSFVTITVNAPPNTAPTARITTLLSGRVGTVHDISAATSTDPEGDSLTYAWELFKPDGSTGPVLSPNAQMTSFLPDTAGMYSVRLTVSDGILSSVPELVVINILPKINNPPVANAGPDKFIQPRTFADLSASLSTDTDNDSLTYTWSLLSRPIGSFSQLTSSVTENTRIFADVVGVYRIELTVSDGQAQSKATVTVTATFDTQSPSLTLFKPTEGAYQGLIDVEWETSDPNGDEVIVKIEYLLDGRGTPVLITDNIKNTEKYQWDSTSVADGNYAIRVTASDGLLSISRDSPLFTVSNDPNTFALTLIKPNGGELFTNIVPVRWLARNGEKSLKIKLEYSFDDGFSWKEIASNLPNTGAYDWNTVGLFEGIFYRLRITVSDDARFKSVISEKTFTIKNGNSIRGDGIQSPRDEIYLDRLKFAFDKVSPGKNALLLYRLGNEGNRNFREDFTITASIPQLGVRTRRGPFNLEKGESVSNTLAIKIPSNTLPGRYPVRITISTELSSRTEYRMIDIVRR